MRKFRFRLERVLDYRNTVKREKELELIEKNHQLMSAEEQLADIVSAHDSLAEQRAISEKTMADLALELTYQAALQEMLLHQRILVLEATEAVEQARDAYIEKAIEAETLETLRERRKEEFQLEQKRKERKSQDQLVVLRHRLTKKDQD